MSEAGQPLGSDPGEAPRLREPRKRDADLMAIGFRVEGLGLRVGNADLMSRNLGAWVFCCQRTCVLGFSASWLRVLGHFGGQGLGF